MNLFVPKDFKPNVLEAIMQAVPDLEQKVKIIKNWQKAIKEGKVDRASEQELQAEFLHKIFGQVLGYTDDIHLEERNLRREIKTETDQTKPDGILGYFRFEHQHLPNLSDYLTKPEQFKDFQGLDVRAVIELKQALVNLDKPQRKSHFKGSPVEQGFSYIPKFGKQCKWVLISDFKEIRLYHHSDMNRSEVFEITQLLEGNNLAKFFFLLQKDRLFLEKQESPVDILFAERRAAEEKITLDFYNEYSEIREILFHHLRKSNPQEDPLLLLSVTQKLLDRVIFMAFVRDTIPTANVIGDALKAEELLAYEQDDKLWHILKKLFRSYDRGFFDKIPNFNGGLFQRDEFLEEKISLKDDHIRPLLFFVLKYDFQSELNVNILGHIFEQSIADLEEMRSEIATQQTSPIWNEEYVVGTRKKEGIFYTPDYITRYIVRHSVGAWLDEQKEALLAKHETENLAYWQDYSEVLRSIKVLDPACGSGAFLTQVFEYLWAEWKIVLAERAKLETKGKHQNGNGNGLGGMFEGMNQNARQEWEVKKQIVQNNIYGVDLNMESIAISKLAMWLLTANKLVTLADLSPNIKQGNSLIDDRSIDEYAFDWQKEFPFAFDVVVGNPPYVRADIASISHQRKRKWITAHFEYLYEKWDLMVAFYERGLKLLKSNGYLSFICSESILTSKYAYKLQEWIIGNFWVKRIDYFRNIEVFEGVGVVPTILTIKKAPPQNIIDKVFREDEFDKFIIKRLKLEKLTKENIFRPNYTQISIRVPTEDLKNICYISVGMVINADELTAKNEFSKNDILSPQKTAIHSVPLVEGKDLKRYEIERIKYIEWGTDRVPAKLRRPTFPELYEGEKILRGRITGGVYDDTGITCNDGVMIFKRYIDLKGVKQKTISISISKNHFSDKESRDNRAIELKRNNLEQISSNFHLKYLLGIINSKFAYWFLNNSRRHRIQNYFYPDDFRELPIAKTDMEKQNEIVKRVDIILLHHHSLSKVKDDFWQLIPKKSKPKNITRKLENWHLLDWDSLKEEMLKVRINVEALPPKQKQILKDDFTEFKKDAMASQISIDKTDHEINQLVYQLYQLTPEEIAIVENAK
jgi:type I restriction-modification system DNA methylase subunit